MLTPRRRTGCLAEAAAEAARTPRQIARRLLVAFFDHLDKHKDLVPRLIGSSNAIHYVRGAQDSIGFKDDCRSRLSASDHVTIHDVPGAAHLVMVDCPREVALLVIEVLRNKAVSAA